MIDRDRILAKLDQLDGYLAELRSIVPGRFEDYQRVETRRACERLVQVLVETVIDTCALLVSALRLGLPGEEDDLFEKLAQRGVLSPDMVGTLRRMKGLRNILVHGYGRINDEVVYDAVRYRLADLEAFKQAVLAFLRST